MLFLGDYIWYIVRVFYFFSLLCPVLSLFVSFLILVGSCTKHFIGLHMNKTELPVTYNLFGSVYGMEICFLRFP